MEHVSKLEIQIEDFRAIKSADIKLNGITVIAGNNGCGKSTISKLLYHTFKTSINFNKIVGEELFGDLKTIRMFVEELSREVDYFLDRINISNTINNKEESEYIYNLFSIFNYNDELKLKEQEIKILSSIDKLRDAYVKIPNQYKSSNSHHSRFYRIERYFKEEFFEKSMDSREVNIPLLIDSLKKTITRRFEEAYRAIEKRPISFLYDILEANFCELNSLKRFNIYELGAPITNRKERKLSNFLTIDKVLYIDTPMILGIDNIKGINVPHWRDTDNVLKTYKVKSEKNNEINKILANEIIKGESSYDEKRNLFFYKRDDGFETNLFHCATGLKSFSLLQILYNNGYLDNKTLLIIDEPETHLHPEWVVQYARLIVLLNKYLKVNFLISSHSQDMVSAIKFIAKKELVDDPSTVNFYFAKDVKKYQYEFVNTQTDVDMIFDSFNKSLDRMIEFGSTEL